MVTYWLVKKLFRRWELYRELSEKEKKKMGSFSPNMTPVKLVAYSPNHDTLPAKQRLSSVVWHSLVTRDENYIRIPENEIPLYIHEYPEVCEKLLSLRRKGNT